MLNRTSVRIINIANRCSGDANMEQKNNTTNQLTLYLYKKYLEISEQDQFYEEFKKPQMPEFQIDLFLKKALKNNYQVKITLKNSSTLSGFLKKIDSSLIINGKSISGILNHNNIKYIAKI